MNIEFKKGMILELESNIKVAVLDYYAIDAKKVIKEFNSFKDAATYGRSIKKYLKETNKGYEETLGFASICCAIGPNGNKYQFYYAF